MQERPSTLEATRAELQAARDAEVNFQGVKARPAPQAGNAKVHGMKRQLKFQTLATDMAADLMAAKLLVGSGDMFGT